MVARRLYRFEWGSAPESPKFIVCEWLDADYRRAEKQVPPLFCFSEEDLLTLEGGREALDAWRRRDDSVAERKEDDFERCRKLEAESHAKTKEAIEMGWRLLRERGIERGRM